MKTSVLLLGTMANQFEGVHQCSVTESLLVHLRVSSIPTQVASVASASGVTEVCEKTCRTANGFRWRCGGYEIMFLGILY